MATEWSFGQRVRDLRRARQLTQQELSARTGLDVTYLSKIENDRLEYTPSIRALQALAREFKVDELELVRAANKVYNAPVDLQVITQSVEALRFFRRAAETHTTAEEWRRMLDYLELQRRARRSEADRGDTR